MEDYPVQVEILQDRPGFNRFINSWVCAGDVNVVIDVGTAATVDRLISALRSMDLEWVDWVLLTHIHLDHAGGLAGFLEAFPMARAVCHAKAVKLMIDPSRLWAGSLKVLGELAEMYGQPRPVPPERLIPHTEVNLDGLGVFETPGHAFHHLSYTWRGSLFAGEVGGVFYQVGDRKYVRPATPPKFFLEEALGSVDRLLALDDGPIFYGHFGWSPSSREMLGRARRQLLLWKEIIGAELEAGDGDDLEDRCLAAVLARDPEIEALDLMDEATQARERYFIANSVKGYLGYLKGDD